MIRKDQLKKILALLLFVAFLAGATVFLYNNYVKKSPYYKQEPDVEQSDSR